MAGAIRRFFDLLAKMGLSVRDDPPKAIIFDARQWSPAVAGLRLSVSPMPVDEPGGVPTLSIMLRNVGNAPVSLDIPEWLFFYRLDMEGADLTPYGRALLSGHGNNQRQMVKLGPGGFVETQVPLGAIYSFRTGVPHRVTVTCDPPGAGQTLSASSAII